MGSRFSLDIPMDELFSYEIGTVAKTGDKYKRHLRLYYRPDQDIFTIPVKDQTIKPKNSEPILDCEDRFQVEDVAGIAFDETDDDDGKSTLNLNFLIYSTKSQKLITMKYIFIKEYTEALCEFKLAQEKLFCFNSKKRGRVERSLCIFVNPISGKKLSRPYFKNILKPVLDFNEIKYESFETDSSTYIENFVEELDTDEGKYTDFVIVGGDGLFGQLVNSIMKHPDKDQLLKIPIGFMPGGSHNALCCDIGCKDPFKAAIHIARGNTVKGDMFRVELQDTNTVLYSTALTYGFPCALSIESERLRNWFGRYRYLACGFKKVFLSTNSILYDTEIHYKCDDESTHEEGTRCKPVFKRIVSKQEEERAANVPKSMQFKSLASKSMMPEQDGWLKLPFDNRFLFVAVVTHEIRSSINKEVFAPFAKLGEGTMYVSGVKRVSRLNALKYVDRASKNTHLTYDKFFYKKVSELKFKCPPGSHLCVDGEPFKSSDFYAKLLPGFINLIGHKDHVNMNL